MNIISSVAQNANVRNLPRWNLCLLDGFTVHSADCRFECEQKQYAFLMQNTNNTPPSDIFKFSTISSKFAFRSSATTSCAFFDVFWNNWRFRSTRRVQRRRCLYDRGLKNQQTTCLDGGEVPIWSLYLKAIFLFFFLSLKSNVLLIN